jgi:hypothetical protein
MLAMIRTGILVAILLGSAFLELAFALDAESKTPSFRNEVMAVLSRAGCNMGTCHGNANGKGGFKLSLRGQSPDADFETLTRELGSRRVSRVDPISSLLLRKPTMAVPHQGGRRFDEKSREYRILRDWIAAGMPGDRDDIPNLTGLTATPEHSTIYEPEKLQRLGVTAIFSDGSSRDVSHLVVFESSALFVNVNAEGVATAEHSGQTVVTARYLDRQIPIRLEFVPDRPGFEFAAPAPASFIDEAVFAQLKRLRVNPSEVCSDSVFVRRVFLDVTGLLPPPNKAREFVASTNPQKRARLIDGLLASPGFNDMMALRWADLLKVEEKSLDKKGVAVFHKWIRDSFVKEKPLNQFAKELLEARGSTYKVPQTNLYRTLRDPSARGEATAQLFLGIRLQCARCHNHPFDHWTQDDYYGWSNYFARVDYKIIENKRRDKFDKHEFVGEQIVQVKKDGDVTNPGNGKPASLRFLGEVSGEDSATNLKPDRLQQVAAWMSAPENSRFAATQANRIWFQLMGRGIVDPVDDFRSTNPPSNPELLDALTRHFVESGFQVRPLMRTILNSKTYQSSSTPNETNQGEAHLFARVEPRRLTAEQTLDAITQVIGVPAEFGDHKLGTKAVQLAGVRNATHRFAERKIGDDFLTLFGKPGRQLTCECERTDETTLAQTFELCGGNLIDQLLQSPGGRIAVAMKQGDSDEQIITELYWAALSRGLTPNETSVALKFVRSNPNRRKALEDVLWALLNSNELLLRY